MSRRSGPRDFPHRRKFREHRVHPARAPHAIIRDRDHDPHFQNELKKVGPQHAPQAAKRNVKSGERNQKENADRQSSRPRFFRAPTQRCSSSPWSPSQGSGNSSAGQDTRRETRAETPPAFPRSASPRIARRSAGRSASTAARTKTRSSFPTAENSTTASCPRFPACTRGLSPRAACPRQTSSPPSKFPPATTPPAAPIQNILPCSGSIAAGNKSPAPASAADIRRSRPSRVASVS